MKERLKRVLSESMRRRLRRLGRLRWITKARVVRHNGGSVREWLGFVLLDPEVDSFTYPISNQHALAEALADVLQRPADEIGAYIAETASDPTLRRALRQPWHHWFWSKREPEPRADHQACWAVLRATRPVCAVETGILDGMASTVMLAALERNAAEGHEGQLFSFDVMPGAGAMVPAWLRPRWNPVYEDAVAALDRVLGSRQVGFFTSDSLPNVDQIRAELDAVLRHRAPQLVAMTTWGSLGDLGWPTPTVTTFKEEPSGHFYNGGTINIASL